MPSSATGSAAPPMDASSWARTLEDRQARTSVMPRTADAVFYQLYFQEPGVAEAELEREHEAANAEAAAAFEAGRFGGVGGGGC